ncbi:phosphoglucosamine mutase [Chloroflexota bacterium]
MRLFGTSGIRAVVDSWLIGLTLMLGLAVGILNKKVVVGCDTRTSSSAMKHAVIAGLLAAGVDCYDAGVVPTPTLALATEGFDAGIMITASHNPPEYNGIKMINPDGSAFNRQQQQQIETMLVDNSIATVSWDGFKSSKAYPDAVEKHIVKILADFPGRFNLKVVLDCDCGAGSVITPQLLQRMGCDVIAMNCNAGGFFPHAIEPKEDNLGGLMKKVREADADLGITHDGDADRLMAVDDKGRFVSGDKLLVILAREIEARKVVSTIDASMAIEEAGFDIVRTSVGDNAISEELKNGGDFGGEPSGSWIIPKNSLCPDGIYTAALLVSIASKKKLSTLADNIAEYPLIRGSVGSDDIIMQQLEEALIAALKPQSVSRTDGIKLNLEDGWLLLRASGTEPKIRLTVEAETQEKAQELYNNSITLIKEFAAEKVEN